MRGKTKIWALTVLFIATMAIASVNIQKSYSYVISTVSLVDPTDGDHKFGGPTAAPGDIFAANVEIDYVEGLRAIDFTVKWNQRVLKLVKPDGTPVPAANTTEFGLLLEGPFLKSIGLPTSPVAALGVAGELVMFSDYIGPKDYVDGGSIDFGPIATIHFQVVGGGETDLTIDGRLLGINFNVIPGTIWVGGHYWGPFPFVDLTWWVPTAKQLSPVSTVSVNGTVFGRSVDEEGDVDYFGIGYYVVDRPVLNLDRKTGLPESIVNVEGGTMFYGDTVILDASRSYDVDDSIASYHWVIREGGVDTFKWGGVTYKTRYETGDPDPTYSLGDTAIIKWLPPFRSSIYGRLLGWADLILTVTDIAGHESHYYTWIRIFRLNPAKTVMTVVPNPKHSLLKDGNTLIFGGKVQNRGGTNYFQYDAMISYLELGRMIHGYMWIRMKFDILDSDMVPVGTVYSDAIWLGPTENLVDPYWVTWTIPDTVKENPGTYWIKMTASFCNAGERFGLKATGAELVDFEILP